jgi:hypothetical protein
MGYVSGQKNLNLCRHGSCLQVTVPNEYVNSLDLQSGEQVLLIPTEWEHIFVLKFNRKVDR